MLKTVFSMIAFVPAALAAQVTASSSARAQTNADAHVGKSASVGAASSTSVEAELATARSRGLPERPIQRRAAEGRAKGASEAQVAIAARRVRMNLEATQDAMIRAGRSRPSDEEIERGAAVMERGYTRAHIEAVAMAAPADRSLVVAFDVLAKLSERGIPTVRALAQVQSKLESRASDTSIAALVSANTNANLGVRGPASAAAVQGNAAAGAAASVGAGAASATGAVTGTVKGVIKP